MRHRTLFPRFFFSMMLLLAPPLRADDVSINVPSSSPSGSGGDNALGAPLDIDTGGSSSVLSKPPAGLAKKPVAAPQPAPEPVAAPAGESPMGGVPTTAGNEHFQIAAVVNEDIITRLDLEERMQLAIATTGLPNTAEVHRQLLGRILQNLVDESLQQQEAKKNSITVAPSEVDHAIASLEQERGKAPGALVAFLEKRGVPERTFRKQLETQIAWSKLVGRKIRKNVKVTNEEIGSEIERRMSPQSKKQEVLLASMVLPVESPDAEPATRELAEKLVEEIHHGASFEALTTQLSSTQGVNIGATWIDIGQLEPQVAEKVDETDAPGIIGPVRSPAGYQILQVKEKRETTVTNGDSEVNFKRIQLSLADNAQMKEVDVLMGIAKNVAKAPGACSQKGIAGIDNFEGLNIQVDYQHTLQSRLSSQLLPLVERLKVGEVSEPFATPKGLELLMLREKTQLPVAAPDRDKVQEQIFRQKLELEAQKYMRNLRRSAYLDFRVHPSKRGGAPE